jgi:CubicO group peptidase (beta-lactamase class C family)
MKALFVIMAGVTIGELAAGAAPAQTNCLAWNWTTASPESQGMSSARLKAMTEALAARKTSALLVIRNDKIICEWNAPGLGPTNQHGIASMAKALVGGVSMAVALTDQRLALDDQAAKFIPQWQHDPRKRLITLRQLGSHSSGLADAEAQDLPHEKLTGWEGDFWKRLPSPRDPFTISRDITPVLFEPGQKDEYSNPGIAMLAYAITAALKDAPQKDLRTLLRERVMRPIGVPDAEWLVGYQETPVVDGLPLVAAWGGGSFTTRAAARVGQLMLHQGNWEGQQLLSPEAVRLVTTDAGTPSTCGIGWWSNNKAGWVKGVKDAFWAAGGHHEIMLVVPSLKLIAVRFGRYLSDKDEEPDPWIGPVNTFLFEPLVNAVIDTSNQRP